MGAHPHHRWQRKLWLVVQECLPTVPMCPTVTLWSLGPPHQSLRAWLGLLCMGDCGHHLSVVFCWTIELQPQSSLSCQAAHSCFSGRREQPFVEAAFVLRYWCFQVVDFCSNPGLNEERRPQKLTTMSVVLMCQVLPSVTSLLSTFQDLLIFASYLIAMVVLRGQNREKCFQSTFLDVKVQRERELKGMKN